MAGLLGVWPRLKPNPQMSNRGPAATLKAPPLSSRKCSEMLSMSRNMGVRVTGSPAFRLLRTDFLLYPERVVSTVSSMADTESATWKRVSFTPSGL